jgi:hypothetical protein
MSTSIETRDILLQIARCPNAGLNLNEGHPCADIVATQRVRQLKNFRVPEPWRGNIQHSPLLFIGSNPSFGQDDDCPTSAATNDDIYRYYTRGFPECFPRIRNKNGQESKNAVRYWSAIRARAAELYQCEKDKIRPGVDFVITEIVHCKSQREMGVPTALDECINRYFSQLMSLSPARIVVVLGKLARKALKLAEDYISDSETWCRKKQFVVTLPHPNARMERTFSARYSKNQIRMLREALNEARRS